MVRLLSLTTILASFATAFQPTPPPRFDVFAERLVGSWNTFDDSISGKQKIMAVEEVMRSCGGAVQGLREPIPDQESIYLNRANDGFVFFDNGCYTSGPLQLGSDEIYLCSIMVGNDKSRVVMYGNGDPDRNKFTLQWKNTGALFDKNPPTLQMEPVPCDLKINFAETIVCSKATPTWMLPRAKWQKGTEEKTGTDLEAVSLNGSIIRCWSLTQSALEFYKWMSLSKEKEEEEGTVVQFGALCEATGQVNLMARQYDTSNDLKQVLFAEGAIAQS